MAGEFIKPTSVKPAVLGTIANPDDYNQNIAGQSKDNILPIDINGDFTDGDLGDETIVANGALIKDIKVREGNSLKTYICIPRSGFVPNSCLSHQMLLSAPCHSTLLENRNRPLNPAFHQRQSFHKVLDNASLATVL